MSIEKGLLSPTHNLFCGLNKSAKLVLLCEQAIIKQRR
jgi:hypothetical protein